jgi:hypothetical protein
MVVSTDSIFKLVTPGDLLDVNAFSISAINVLGYSMNSLSGRRQKDRDYFGDVGRISQIPREAR